MSRQSRLRGGDAVRWSKSRAPPEVLSECMRRLCLGPCAGCPHHGFFWGVQNPKMGCTALLLFSLVSWGAKPQEHRHGYATPPASAVRRKGSSRPRRREASTSRRLKKASEGIRHRYSNARRRSLGVREAFSLSRGAVNLSRPRP